MIAEISLLEPVSRAQKVQWIHRMQQDSIAEVLRPWESNLHPKFEKILPPKNISSRPDDLIRLTALALNIVSCFEGLTQEERFKMWEKRKREQSSMPVRIFKDHIKNILVLSLAQAKRVFKDRKLENRARRLWIFLSSSRSWLLGWMDTQACEGVIREYLGKSFGRKQYLELEAGIFKLLIYLVSSVLQRNLGVVATDLRLFTETVEEKAVDYFGSHRESIADFRMRRNRRFLWMKYRKKLRKEVA